jgi:hypothetical protein
VKLVEPCLAALQITATDTNEGDEGPCNDLPAHGALGGFKDQIRLGFEFV